MSTTVYSIKCTPFFRTPYSVALEFFVMNTPRREPFLFEFIYYFLKISFIQTILSFWTIAICVPYLFVMIRMHQKMLIDNSPLKLSYRLLYKFRTQKFIEIEIDLKPSSCSYFRLFSYQMCTDSERGRSNPLRRLKFSRFVSKLPLIEMQLSVDSQPFMGKAAKSEFSRTGEAVWRYWLVSPWLDYFFMILKLTHFFRDVSSSVLYFRMFLLLRLSHLSCSLLHIEADGGIFTSI